MLCSLSETSCLAVQPSEPRSQIDRHHGLQLWRHLSRLCFSGERKRRSALCCHAQATVSIARLTSTSENVKCSFHHFSCAPYWGKMNIIYQPLTSHVYQLDGKSANAPHSRNFHIHYSDTISRYIFFDSFTSTWTCSVTVSETCLRERFMALFLIIETALILLDYHMACFELRERVLTSHP